MEFSRQEHSSWLPSPSPGDLLDPGIEPRSPVLQADSIQSESQGSPNLNKVPPISWVSCMCMCMLSLFSCSQLIATLWAAVQQAPLPLGFSRQEHWSGCHAFPRASTRPRDGTCVSLHFLHRQAGFCH